MSIYKRRYVTYKNNMLYRDYSLNAAGAVDEVERSNYKVS